MVPQFHFSIIQLTDKQYSFWRETHTSRHRQQLINS